jgi:ammonia channel protein AmtB
LLACRYGFNPGSALQIVGFGPTVALCAINTTLAGASGTIACMITLLILGKVEHNEVVWDLLGTANGTLAGLVGICSGVSTVEVGLRPLHQRIHIAVTLWHSLQSAATL